MWLFKSNKGNYEPTKNTELTQHIPITLQIIKIFLRIFFFKF